MTNLAFIVAAAVLNSEAALRFGSVVYFIYLIFFAGLRCARFTGPNYIFYTEVVGTSHETRCVQSQVSCPIPLKRWGSK
jgi:hypothetical protein